VLCFSYTARPPLLHHYHPRVQLTTPFFPHHTTTITYRHIRQFGLEQYNGTVKALAVDRFASWNYPKYTYSGYMDGFNAATQCIGSIIVGPLMTIFPIKTVLSTSLLVFAVISMIIMCVEKANGGTFPTKCVTKDLLPPVCTGATAGNWDPAGIIPVFVFSGIPFGAIEIVRRIIPQQIVGGNEMKLKKLDSLVHVYFEIAGTCGAFFAAYTSLILGKAYAPVITPILYVFAAALFYFIIPPKSKEDISLATGTTAELTTMFLKSLWYSFYGFGESVYQGALIIFAESKYHWLVWGYTIPLGTSALVAIQGPVFPSVLTALPFSPFRRHPTRHLQ